MYDPNQPDGRGEDVGKRTSTSVKLPVPQIQESHDLAWDLSRIGDAGTSVVMMPYRAMSIADKVTLTLDMYFGENDPWMPYTNTKTLTATDIGKPLKWSVSKNELQVIEDGFAHVSCWVVFATPTVPCESYPQTVHVVSPPDTLLPAPEIKGFAGGDELDPDFFPDGITLSMKPYPGIQVDDDVVVYASGNTSLIKSFRVDPSNIASNILEVTLEYAWLSENNGKDIRLMYQYAREGDAGTSEPLTVTLRKFLNLPMPIVEHATPDGAGKGYLFADSTIGGVYINLPEDAVIGVDDQVQMHWEGYGSTGNHTADPSFGNRRRFHIPQSAVPANMGKRIDVFYKVTPPGKDSMVFDLEIKDMSTGWPTLQISDPPSPSNTVSLADAVNGVEFTLASWPYMRSGQRVRIEVRGVVSSEVEEKFELRKGAAEEVTDDEYYAGQLKATLPRAFLEKLKLNHQFDVSVETSFDGGNTYKRFPWINPKLVD